MKVTFRFTAVTVLFAAFTLASTTQATVVYDLVPVGDPGNAADVGGFGSVAYEYQIGKYEVTIGQYTEFLNAVAKTDTHSLYNVGMATYLNFAGISRAGNDGSYIYSVINNGGDSSNRPIYGVSWFNAARFANWMANGQPTGAQSIRTTENGAYNVNGATSGNAMAKNAINPNTFAAPTFYIPTENEWYKAAYYSPEHGGIGSPGYFLYATQSDAVPGNVIGGAANQANYYNGVLSVTQSANQELSQNYLTDVGAFSGSGSFYGTFDQSGNVEEWNDRTVGGDSERGFRGGAYWDGTGSMSRKTMGVAHPDSTCGFRLASPNSSAPTGPVILTVEKTTALLSRQWTPVPITANMITPEGELNVGALTNTHEFYRLKGRIEAE